MFRAGGEVRGIPALTSPAVMLADVSEFEPQVNDPVYLAWSKAIIIRALYGSQHDDAAWYGGQRRDLLHAGGARFLGIYAYITAGEDAAVQAHALVSLLGHLRPGEKLIADLEEGDGNQAARWRQWSAVITAAYGAQASPWLYSGLDYAASHGLSPEWTAAYQGTEPAAPHLLWQFSDAYPVPGVGLADCSVFRGTIDQLAAYGWQEAPANWTFGPPANLKATGGHTTVRLAWDAPAGAPERPAEYLVYVYRGTVCNRTTLVPSYPRTTAGSPWEGGSLERGQSYTAHVVSAGAGGARVRLYAYASAVFTTG
jgi:hypothetical protein